MRGVLGGGPSKALDVEALGVEVISYNEGGAMDGFVLRTLQDILRRGGERIDSQREVAMHWTDVYGREIRAEWLMEEAGRRGLALAAYLEQLYRELGEENPSGGWDMEREVDFEALARQVEREAQA